MKTMNAKIKKRWVADLRKNKKLQGVGYLRTEDDKFCCLGRLCELAVKAGVVKRHGNKTKGYTYGENNMAGILPSEVMVWAEITKNDPAVIYKNNEEELSVLNDNKVSFLRIATLIEKQL